MANQLKEANPQWFGQNPNTQYAPVIHNQQMQTPMGQQPRQKTYAELPPDLKQMYDAFIQSGAYGNYHELMANPAKLAEVQQKVADELIAAGAWQ